MTSRFLACSFASIVISLAFTPGAMADDDHGRGHGHGHDKHKDEYWDGNCKVERKWDKDGDYKEKRKCKGAVYREPQTVVIQQPVIVQPPIVVQRPVVVQPATVVYPPWVVVEQGRPHHYRSGYEPVPPQQVVQTQVSHCNSETVGQVLGGVAGALLGNQVGKGTGRTVATVGGAVAGVLVGGEVGRRMDSQDQACIGQTLELAPAGRRVEWAEGGQQYVVVPGTVVNRGGRYCRPYEAQVRVGNGWQTTRGTACRRNDGVWVTV
jgi:surface antigen